MVKRESNNYSKIIISDSKNEKLSKKLKNILPTITKNIEETSKNFIKSIRKLENDENYKCKHPLIERQFLFKAVEEMNGQLTKNNKRFLLDYVSKLCKFFDDEVGLYLLMNGCITKYGKVSRDIVDKKIYQIYLEIKEHTNDEKFILYTDKLETNLPIIYINVS